MIRWGHISIVISIIMSMIISIVLIVVPMVRWAHTLYYQHRHQHYHQHSSHRCSNGQMGSHTTGWSWEGGAQSGQSALIFLLIFYDDAHFLMLIFFNADISYADISYADISYAEMCWFVCWPWFWCWWSFYDADDFGGRMLFWWAMVSNYFIRLPSFCGLQWTQLQKELKNKDITYKKYFPLFHPDWFTISNFGQ